MLALKKQLHILHGFGVNLGRSELFYARPKAALDVVLQARTQVVTRQVYLARGREKIAVDQVYDPVGQICREVRTVVEAAIFAQAAGHVNPRETLCGGPHYIRSSVII